jgi:tRNA-splicing endonuclease subunit Sen15
MESSAPAPAVSPSPLQSLLADPSLLPSTHPAELLPLAFQIQHNLRYQHLWTGLTVHTHSPITSKPLPRPLLSGLPPQRLYVHPEEQIELLKEAEKRRRAAAKESDGDVAALEFKPDPEREWILPTRLSEKWTLQRLSEIFDGIDLVPAPPEGRKDTANVNKWRTTKRLVLATVDADSTVVYYIVHDGVVKPRQN